MEFLDAFYSKLGDSIALGMKVKGIRGYLNQRDMNSAVTAGERMDKNLLASKALAEGDEATIANIEEPTVKAQFEKLRKDLLSGTNNINDVKTIADNIKTKTTNTRSRLILFIFLQIQIKVNYNQWFCCFLFKK